MPTDFDHLSEQLAAHQDPQALCCPLSPRSYTVCVTIVIAQEPRLAKKLIEPLTTLIQSTPAMSVLYECINTIVNGMPDHAASVEVV